MPVPGRAFGTAVSRTGTVLVTLLDQAQVARAHLPQESNEVLDELQVAAPLPQGSFDRTIPVGSVPTDVDFNSDGSHAYVTNQYSNSVSVIDISANQSVDAIPVAANAVRVKVAPGDSILWVTDNVGDIFAIRLVTKETVATLHAKTLANGIALTRERAWFSVIDGTILEVDAQTYQVTRTFSVGGLPQEIVVSDDGSELYVANEYGSVQIIELASGTIAATVPLPGGGGFGMALNKNEHRLYVSTGYITNTVWVIDPNARQIIRGIATGGVPRRIAMNRAGNRALVANESGFVDVVR
jgi:YVTN family beta-propeller protein